MFRPSIENDDLNALQRGMHCSPHDFLGFHCVNGRSLIRVWRPNQLSLSISCQGNIVRLEARDGMVGLFELDCSDLPFASSLSYLICMPNGQWIEDPYRFRCVFSELDAYLFGRGVHYEIFQKLGAHSSVMDGVEGVLFSVWAPRANGVSVVGDFSLWEAEVFPMNRHTSGIWTLFIPRLKEGERYKFAINQKGHINFKLDPFGFQFEERPATSSVINNKWKSYCWNDQKWMERRISSSYRDQPIAIYEVHLGSWKRSSSGTFLSYEKIAQDLSDYVSQLGMTHVELLPVCEHPLDESWGYQTTGYFAPTSRFGPIQEFQKFVDILHQKGIGVILDWVPAHFASDEHALSNFDGFPLFEDADPLRQVHPHWGTLQFDYGRNEVSNFLLASALFWLNVLHIDGLRVDAVSSMLYRDYGRENSSWSPNQYGGKENLESIEFLKHLNSVTHSRAPGTFTVAEESTDWKKMTASLYEGGLGFDFKWQMGWVHDTLRYLALDPYFRGSNRKDISFSAFYSHLEAFLLPLSHDEVVHCKGSLLGKMFGKVDVRFDHLRLLYSYQMCMPGKKLIFMGSEWGAKDEWSVLDSLDWIEQKSGAHFHLWKCLRDLNFLYTSTPALWEWDHVRIGFEWIDIDEKERGIFAYFRKSSVQTLLCIHNFTPVAQDDYNLPFFRNVSLIPRFSSDLEKYGGSSNKTGTIIKPNGSLLSLSLPPYTTLIFEVFFESRADVKGV
ncbi:1,4-alpha-glucan branching protein GlgB [Candidatus Similichlamydia epinepheli]|uniref:1,4-alpha-glucan branching protein GlgB n=1 Tax=Candidatus Similichlamydia epinepheli TaxID=1903953 RepID=UPI00130081F2|nr:1,4-alpha-glucan branching protein GlgB [Candidatus Similichlamydia epinepheli]